MLYFEKGGKEFTFSDDDLKKGLFEALDKLGSKKKVLALPPDYTRFHSKAGVLTTCAWQYYKDSLTDILPALGTHFPMTSQEIEHMFKGVPESLFRSHDWRNDVITLGEVPGEYVSAVSGGIVDYPWPAQVNKLLVHGGFDCILSIGQVVPHEVIGMANYNKNIFVGTGGSEGINRSHFIGAAYGMEKIMGRADTPVRSVLNYASDNFANHLPIIYVQTVIRKNDDGELVPCGLYIGDDIECFNRAASLSLQVNFKMLDKQLKKVVVFLDPSEFKSTWLGNKSIYRTRMAIADEGELIVLAPGLREFGEDKQIDAIIRKYGYVGSQRVLELTKQNKDLQDNLGGAAHLIHGSSDGRFSVTYCPGHLTKAEIESVNFKYGDLNTMQEKYNPQKLKDGFNVVDGEEVFYISNPAIGLWAWDGRFNK